MPGRTLDESSEPIGRVGGFPAAPVGEPPRSREVVEGHDRFDAVLATMRTDPPVVLESDGGPFTLGRLDAAPFERESVGAQPEVGHEVDVLGPAVKGVTGVPARFDAARPGVVLPSPPVVVHVRPFDLVGSGGHTPCELLGEGERPTGLFSMGNDHGANVAFDSTGCTDSELLCSFSNPSRLSGA